MIGLCCQYIEQTIKKNGNIATNNIIEEKNLQYGQFNKGKYSNVYIERTWINNANELLKILKRINDEGFKLFRISSNLFPLYDLMPDLFNSSVDIKNILFECGKFVLANNMRVTTHPDQFVVISSNKDQVINNSLKILDHHAWIFDHMNLPESAFYSINIHGGTKGNSKLLINSINKMSSSVRKRLTLENDELSYNVKELYDVYQETGIPICWDSHHHTFNNAGLSLEEGLFLAKKTWNNIKPLTHLSNTSPLVANGSFTEKRKHSDYVHYIPDCQLKGNNNNEIDIDFEFKMKNLAILKALKDFNIIL